MTGEACSSQLSCAIECGCPMQVSRANGLADASEKGDMRSVTGDLAAWGAE